MLDHPQNDAAPAYKPRLADGSRNSDPLQYEIKIIIEGAK